LAQEFLTAGLYREKSLAKSAENLLLTYSWPGNVRELKSAIDVASVLSDGNQIEASDLMPHLVQSAPVYEQVLNTNSIAEIDEKALAGNFNHLVSEFEMKLIEFAMEKKGSESAAAKYLGVPRSTLGDLRKRLKSLK